MKWSIALFWVTLVTAASSLVQINDYNFDKLVKKSGDFVLVDFYADWCRHCKQLMPTIEKLADFYDKVDGVQIYKINGGDRSGKRMTIKYEIEGFPMLAMFHGEDAPIMYEGARDFESINNFISGISGIKLDVPDIDTYVKEVDPEDVILDINDFNIEELILNSDKKTLLLVSGHWCTYCKEVYPIIEKLSKIYANEPNLQIAVVALDLDGKTTEKISTQFDFNNIPSILFFDPDKVHEDGWKRPELYENAKNLKALVKFLNEKTGAARSVDGRLESTVGKIPKIDGLLKGLFRDSNLAEGIKVLSELDKYDSEDSLVVSYYRKLIAKVLDKETDYFKKEQIRLKKLLKNRNNIQFKALDRIDKRLNILDSFIKNR